MSPYLLAAVGGGLGPGADRLSQAVACRLPLAVGFLGGVTTCSSVEYETFRLIESGVMLRAVACVGLSPKDGGVRARRPPAPDPAPGRDEGVRSRPAAVHALRGADLGTDEGEFVAVMGSSGSGKSACLNIRGAYRIQAPVGEGVSTERAQNVLDMSGSGSPSPPWGARSSSSWPLPHRRGSAARSLTGPRHRTARRPPCDQTRR